MSHLFDAYQLRARVQPVLLAAFPAAVLAYALGASDQLVGKITATATTFGIVTLFVAMARDRGARLEQELWAGWGGPPTTTMMLSTSCNPSPDLEVHRNHLKRLLPDSVPLSDVRDRLDPEGSLRTVEQYIRYLRERTRDRSLFPIVFDANAGYGFRRNVLGLRPIGLVVATVSTLAGVVALFLVRLNVLDRPMLPLLFASQVGAVAAALWAAASPRWVKQQADRYAVALLAAAEALESRGAGAGRA